VTQDEVADVARRYFAPENQVVLSMGPNAG
jgi:predicted Zn-dependent peptidase